MSKYLVLKPWSYSLDGFTVKEAAKGAELTLDDLGGDEDLAIGAIINGDLEEVAEKKMRKVAPENKSKD